VAIRRRTTARRDDMVVTDFKIVGKACAAITDSFRS
jgi:hypothetical protein